MTAYDVLGVSVSASEETIRAAWRVAQRHAHPDIPTGSTAKSKAVNAALDELLDPVRRARLDREIAVVQKAREECLSREAELRVRSELTRVAAPSVTAGPRRDPQFESITYVTQRAAAHLPPDIIVVRGTARGRAKRRNRGLTTRALRAVATVVRATWRAGRIGQILVVTCALLALAMFMMSHDRPGLLGIGLAPLVVTFCWDMASQAAYRT